MSAHPKLPPEVRDEIAWTIKRKRRLAKLIAKLKDVKRSIPTTKELARQHNVSYECVRQRVIVGDPYQGAS